MKKITSLVILIIVIALIVLGSRYLSGKNEDIETGGRVRGPEEITLKIGDKKEAAGLTIELNGIVSDSRCPADALCIQAGALTADVILSTDDVSSTTVISTESESIEFAGYSVTIPRALPTRFASTTVTDDQYLVTFLVTPLGQEPEVPAEGKLNGNPTNFAREGMVTFIKRGAVADMATLVYKENAVVATTTLVFDELSFCGGAGGSQQCFAYSITLDVPFGGKRAIVEGIRTGDEVLVRKLHVVSAGTQALVPEAGSVFISWEQARNFINSCGVEMVMQSHNLDVFLKIKGGDRLRTVEPVIDEVFKVVQLARETCGDIPVATE
jgi:hypothetical protein